jgi:putative DNA-invertase from lambdoid prophage Rac
MVYGYIRVSTGRQEQKNQEYEILQFANQKGFGGVDFIQEIVSGTTPWKKRQLAQLVERTTGNDTLIVSELSRLGRSMLEIMEVLSILLRKGCKVYAIKGGYELNNNIQSKVFAFAFSLAAEIERELISQRTKEALARLKSEGKKLGRPKGPGKSRLDPHMDQIKEFRLKQVSLTSMARIFNVTPAMMWKYVKNRGI